MSLKTAWLEYSVFLLAAHPGTFYKSLSISFFKTFSATFGPMICYRWHHLFLVLLSHQNREKYKFMKNCILMQRQLDCTTEKIKIKKNELIVARDYVSCSSFQVRSSRKSWHCFCPQIMPLSAASGCGYLKASMSLEHQWLLQIPKDWKLEWPLKTLRKARCGRRRQLVSKRSPNPGVSSQGEWAPQQVLRLASGRWWEWAARKPARQRRSLPTLCMS